MASKRPPAQATPPKAPDPLYILRGGHSDNVTCLAFGTAHDTCKLLLSGSASGIVCIWSLITRRLARVLQLHSAALLSLSFTPDDAELVSQARDGTVKLWSKEAVFTRELLDASETDLAAISSLRHSEQLEPQYIAARRVIVTRSHSFGRCCTAVARRRSSSSGDHEQPSLWIAAPAEDQSHIAVWDANADSDQPVYEIKPSESCGMCMDTRLVLPVEAPSGSPSLWLLASYENGEILSWKLNTEAVIEQPVSRIEAHKLLPAICFTMNREGTKGLSAGAANCLCSWTFDRTTGALAIDKSLPLKKAGVAAVALREDERIALTAGWDSTVRIWNWNKQKPLAILKYHTESVQAAAFAARGSNLLASASTNRIAVWAIY